MGWFGFGPGIPYLGWGSGNTMGNSYWEGPAYTQHQVDVNRSAEDNRKDSKTFLKYLLFATVTILALATGKGMLSSLFHRSSSSSEKEVFKDTLSLKGKSTEQALNRLNKGLDHQYFSDVQKHLRKYERTGDYTDLQKHLFENVPNGQRGLLSRFKTLEDSMPSGYTIDTLLNEPNLSAEGLKYRDLRRSFKEHEKDLIEEFRQNKAKGLLPKDVDDVKKYAKYRQEAIDKLPKRIDKRFNEAIKTSEYQDFLKWAYNSPEYREKFFHSKISTLDEIKKSKTRTELLAHQAALKKHHTAWKEEHKRLAAITDADKLKEAHQKLDLDQEYINTIRTYWKGTDFDLKTVRSLGEFHELAAKVHETSLQDIDKIFERLLEKAPLDETSIMPEFHSQAQSILMR